ncbi:MAG: putative repeat protein (TIGR03806 family), partial [Kiritimatiellia bacterium]
CDVPGLIDPIAEYDHSQGRSITGGEVYRGASMPDLQGVYLFADFYPPAPVWGLFQDPQTGETKTRKLGQVGTPVGTFAQGADGEVYIPVYSGQILKIVPSTPSEGAPFPQHLSETGCTDGADASKPSSGLIPYGVNQPLWSDDADKRRWIGLPDDTVATVGEEGHLELPNGTVLVKEFALDGVRLETRLLVRHEDGGWGGYAYKWLPDGSDAVWVPAGGTSTQHGGTWAIPSQAQCTWCHTEAAGGSLGLELAQLDGSFVYPNDVQADQLTTWQHLGLLDVPDTIDALPTPHGDDSVQRKARAYLHSNCAHCHRPNGDSGSELDLRWSRDLAQINACDVEPDKGNLGVDGAKLLVPGDPSKSIISLRMHDTGEGRMPQVGTVIVDDASVAVIDAWIEDLRSCP